MKDKMTIILFSGDLDKAIAAFILATTAAASNMEVCIFFTFWGLNVLKKDHFALSSKQTILQKLFNIFSPGTLPTSRLNLFGMGPWMMKKIMKHSKMATLEELMATARKFNVKYIACTTSCGVLGVDKELLSGDVDEFAGAMSYLAAAKESKVNLFI